MVQDLLLDNLLFAALWGAGLKVSVMQDGKASFSRRQISEIIFLDPLNSGILEVKEENTDY